MEEKKGRYIKEERKRGRLRERETQKEGHEKEFMLKVRNYLKYIITWCDIMLYSAESFFFCVGKCTPGPVSNIDITKTDSEITIGWDSPQPDCCVKKYEVEYWIKSNKTVIETFERAYRLSGLQQHTKVLFLVRPQSCCGKQGQAAIAVESTGKRSMNVHINYMNGRNQSGWTYRSLIYLHIYIMLVYTLK